MKACLNKCIMGKPQTFVLNLIIIIPNCLKVENATIFFKSIDIMANIEPNVIVTIPNVKSVIFKKL